MLTGQSAVAQQEGISMAQLGSMIEQDQYVDYMEQGAQVSRMDLGSAMINKVLHPTLGLMLLISTDSGATALISLC
jgi:hypothetical protein